MSDLRLYSYVELATAWRVSPRTVETWVSTDERKGIRVPRIRRKIARGIRIVLLTGDTAAELLRRHQPRLFGG